MHLSHLLRTDIRHFRWLLAGWVLIQAMSTVYAGTSPFASTDGRFAAPIAALGFVLILARWLGLAFMVPLLLQTDPAVGSDAFWLTRPIPWRTMLLSKIVLIGGACVGLPVVFEMILMAVYQVPLRYIVMVGVQGLLLQGLVVAVLLALGALTRTLAGFAIVAGGLLLAVGVLMNVGLIFAMRMLEEGPQIYEVHPRLVSSAAAPVVILTAWIAALALVVAVQYRLRSTRAAVSTAVVALALVIALPFVWPGSDHALAAPEWAGRDSALQLVVQAPRVSFTLQDRWLPSHRPVEWFIGDVQLRLNGVEKTWLGTLRLIDSSLRMEDGSTLETVGNEGSKTVLFEGVDDSPAEVVTRDLLGVSRIRSAWTGPIWPDSVPAIHLKEADVRQRFGSAALYRGRFMLDLDRLQVSGVVPLQPGAEFRDGGNRIVVEGVQRRGSGAQLLLRQIAVTTFFNSGSDRPQFYLRNPRTSEALEGREAAAMASSGSFAISGVSMIGANGVGLNLRRQLYEFGRTSMSQFDFEITPEWLAQSELVLVERIASGSISRTIEIPSAELVEAPRPATSR